MLRTPTLLALLCALGVALGPAAPRSASAGERGFGGGHHRRHGPPPLDRILERHAERLGLDEATQAKIREIAAAAHDGESALDEQLRAQHDALRALLDQENPDEAAVMAQAERIGALETERRKRRLQTMLQIRALLTPEQRRELVEIHEERRAERRERSGDEKPPGPPDLEDPR
jgi:Spy/CpxP family protein refolding chaperone